MITASRVEKSFGQRKVLRGIDLSINGGEIVALIGLNGAGKTTLIRLLSSLLKPDSGQVLVDELSLKDDPSSARRKLGVVLHSSMLYGNLTARENLDFYARLYGLDDNESTVSNLLNLIDLFSRADDRVNTFSRGMQQRLSIARALIHNPAYLLMDEVFTGLDEQFINGLISLVKAKATEGKGILFSTHDLDLVFSVATRVDILHRGRIVFSQPVHDLNPRSLLDVYQKEIRSHEPERPSKEGSR